MNIIDAVKACKPFVGKGDTRAALAHVIEDRRHVVACDGRIIAVAYLPGCTLAGDPAPCYAGTQEPCPLYPSWTHVLVNPANLIAKVVMCKSALVNALQYLVSSWKDASKVREEYVCKSSPHLVSFIANERVCELTADDTHNSARFECEVTNDYSEMPPCTWFNAEYLLKAVKAIDAPRIAIHLQSDNRRASLIRSDDARGESFQVTLMPVAVKDPQVAVKDPQVEENII